MSLPLFFQNLVRQKLLTFESIHSTPDGFFAADTSIADILKQRNILTFPNDQGEPRLCQRFYDDWYLYAVPAGEDFVYSLFKMREQEFDAQEGVPGDGDTPGVTVCFIALNPAPLQVCLDNPTEENRQAWNRELNRVVSVSGQSHHPVLKDYFIRAEADGSYLIARLYIRFLTSLSKGGQLPVPLHYAEIFRQSQLPGASAKCRRLPEFLEANNAAAGRTVCDHRFIYLQNPEQPTPFEQKAILATHAANTSFHSFAAEIRYHAWFLFPMAKLPLPIVGHSVYASAIRADMTIDDTEFEGPAPFHREDSRWLREQAECHPEYSL